MILSMTGFGEARAHEDGITYQVEIRSQNNRYFKVSMRLPEQFQRYEVEIDRQLRSRLGRGSVTHSLRVADENAPAAYEIDKAALSQYITNLQEVARAHDGVSIDLAGLLNIPGVCRPSEVGEEKLKEQYSVVQQLTSEATDKLIEMRRAEGRALQEDLLGQCADIRARLAEIEVRSPLVVKEYARRLRSRVEQLLNGSTVELEQDALAREVAVFAERCDINEEVSRMRSHLDQFAGLCDEPEAAGRKLEFLAQELLREANTIGSKANDVEIARHVVEIKAAVDRLKEQVQNVA